MNLPNLKWWLAAFQISAFLIFSNQAQAQIKAYGTTNQTPFTAKDIKFMKTVSKAGGMEIALGQTAQQNAKDERVRGFGEKMVQDHQKAAKELTDLVNQKGGAMPVDDSAGEDKEKMVGEMQKLHGAEFDKTYMKQMVSDHKDVIAAFQHEMDRGDNPELRAWASRTLPILQEHLTMAKDIEAEVSATTATTGTNVSK